MNLENKIHDCFDDPNRNIEFIFALSLLTIF